MHLDVNVRGQDRVCVGVWRQVQNPLLGVVKHGRLDQGGSAVEDRFDGIQEYLQIFVRGGVQGVTFLVGPLCCRREGADDEDGVSRTIPMAQRASRSGKTGTPSTCSTIVRRPFVHA